MSQPKVLMLSSECVPFAKTSGVADVVGSLPLELKRTGVDVRLALPHYSVIDAQQQFRFAPLLAPFPVPIENRSDQAAVSQAVLPRAGTNGHDDEVPVYFVENERLYKRDGIYMFPDDAERFIFFCRAALEMCRRLDWQPDVIHCHDWQTAIVPNWLKTIYADDPFFRNTATVYTIHNLAFQGLFGHRVLEIAGLAAQGFIAHPDVAADINQQVDFMARGILFADAITTVSERYAKEILTPEFGEKLDPILRARKDRLFGILNGIDYRRFNPATDTYIARTYDVDSLDARRENKASLQRELGLSEDADAPLIGMLSRLNEQKGIYVLRDAIEPILKLGVQFALMGTGNADLQNFFADLQHRYPGRVAYAPTFHAPLAAKIFAGSDIYLMPSRFEPAGTNHMIALRFGAVPVVRATGGLADTVQEFDPGSGRGNGFTFTDFDQSSLVAAVARALEAYRFRDAWRTIQQNGMRLDLSWRQSAERYVNVYRFALEKKHSIALKQQQLADDIARTARIIAELPPRIGRLGELAYNLWWSWNYAAQELYERIDAPLWHALTHNPVKFLREVARDKVEAVERDPKFCEQYDRVLQQFDDYMGTRTTWYDANYPYASEDTIAYLSFEFGLHESLPIYSGGLGVLAGDMCKEASDVGLPLVAVGFLYPQGFFHQQIDAQGNQIALEEKVNFAEVPAVALKDKDGRDILIGVDMPGRTIYAQLWRIQVGRIPLIMMDTDIEQNAPQDRRLVAQLYHGDQEVRIAQEMIFGIGSVRALRALGINPSLWHLNEGHGAFVTLELARELVVGAGGQAPVPFDQARERVRAQNVFSTHTPVPAGNDEFSLDLIDKFFRNFYPQLALTRDEFMNLGLHDGRFSMTVLALRLSAAANGVSKLHGEVSRQMWGWLWPGTPADRVPIRSITNGVHTATWLAPDLEPILDWYLGADWHARIDDPTTWEPVLRVPDEDLWAIHQAQRRKLVGLLRAHARERALRLSLGDGDVSTLLDPDILTVGFARRFATYKRATLIFHDVERLKRMLNDPRRPMQIIFAGKAHPADQPGQDLIRQVYHYSQMDGLSGRIHFLEEYNMDTARYLTAGADVWLNNPRRPLEASGTSGMKASLNGVPTASILDGWWIEGYNGADGWAVASADPQGMSPDQQDAADAESLYTIFEQQIIPLFYERDDKGIPRRWIKVMKDAMRTVAPRFSTRRMVKEYAQLWVESMAKEGAV